MSQTGVSLSDLLGKVDEKTVRDALGSGANEAGSLVGFLGEAAAGAVAKEVNDALDKDIFEVIASSIVARMPSTLPSVCTDSLMPRPAKMSSILPTPTTGCPAATKRSSTVSRGGGIE